MYKTYLRERRKYDLRCRKMIGFRHHRTQDRRTGIAIKLRDEVLVRGMSAIEIISKLASQQPQSKVHSAH
jgi:hypothetical protein